MIHSNQKIRMYNGVTYSIEEVLNLWAGRTIHCGHLVVGIEEMVELTLEHGSFNPSDLGGHSWGLSMELVEEEEPQSKDEFKKYELVSDMDDAIRAHTISYHNDSTAYQAFKSKHGEWHQALESVLLQMEQELKNNKYARAYLEANLTRGTKKLQEWKNGDIK